MRVHASFSIWGYRSSTSCSALLTKYTGFFTPSSSQIEAPLIAIGETARYRYNTSPRTVLLSRGVLAKYCFSWENASSHSFDYSKAFLNILKKERHLSVDRKMNQFSAANLPVSCWSYFVVFGDCISRIAWIFSNWPRFLYSRPCNRGTSRMTLRMHILWGLASSRTASVSWMPHGGHEHGSPTPCSSPACCLRRPPCSFRSSLGTSCSQVVGTSPLRYSNRRAWPCNNTSLDQ